MRYLSSATPQIGAAIAAGFMVLSAVAYQIGTRSEPGVEREPAGLVEASQTNVQVLTERAIDFAAPSVRVAEDAGLQTQSAVIPVGRPRLAIIIDDVADLQTANEIWSLSAPLTVSVLPYAPEAIAIAEAADGHEVFLHLPMEPVGLQDPGLNALTTALPGESVAARVEWALEQVPGAVGFNNHMGSRLTSDHVAMDRLFEALEGYQERLIFVDSLTHPESIASAAARRAGFIARDRDIFLDHDPGPAAVERQLTRALERAVDEGAAIAIGHPRPETLGALQSLSERAEAAGVDIVPVRELIDG